jgi:hypothetical protein
MVNGGCLVGATIAGRASAIHRRWKMKHYEWLQILQTHQITGKDN